MAKVNLTPGNGDQYRTDGTVVNTADIAEQSLAGKGFDVIADTAAHTPTGGDCYCAIHFLTDTVISAYVASAKAPVAGTLTGVTFNAGAVIYGKFTSITLTSGSLLAYNGAL